MNNTLQHPAIHAVSHPDRPAFIMAASGEIVTYRDLDRRSCQAAQLFRALGLRAGDHIAIQMENNRHFMEIVWGAQRAGLIYTAISSHLKCEEASSIVDNCLARVLISSVALAEVVVDMVGKVNALHLFMVDGTRPGFESWEKALARQSETPIADEQAGIQMLYSSGTTGQPKGILPTWRPGSPVHQMSPAMASLADFFKIDENTVYLSPAPLYHAAPLVYNMLVVFRGGTSVIMEKFDAESSLALIGRYRCTHSQWVPIMFIRMLKLPEAVRAKCDLSSMRFAIHAAAPCPREIKEQMIAWWGNIIWEYYSSTEGAGATIINSEQWLEHPGSVGVPVNSKVHIVDDAGKELPAGKVGAVYFSDGLQSFEYFNDPEKTREAYNEKGWSTFGDVGYVDEAGFLYLTDRRNFMIISGGVNIYPQEIENILITHERVADVAVFGIPNAEFGEEVKAVVQPRHWSDAGDELAQELMQWCRRRLSGVKCPRSIDFKRELPRLDNGKLYKRLLRDSYLKND